MFQFDNQAQRLEIVEKDLLEKTAVLKTKETLLIEYSKQIDQNEATIKDQAKSLRANTQLYVSGVCLLVLRLSAQIILGQLHSSFFMMAEQTLGHHGDKASYTHELVPYFIGSP